MSKHLSPPRYSQIFLPSASHRTGFVGLAMPSLSGMEESAAHISRRTRVLSIVSADSTEAIPSCLAPAPVPSLEVPYLPMQEKK